MEVEINWIEKEKKLLRRQDLLSNDNDDDDESDEVKENFSEKRGTVSLLV